MTRNSPMKWLVPALAATSLVTSSVASAAPVAHPAINPLVALSAFGTAQSRAALCSTATVAASAAVAQSQSGCVLPVVDMPPPVVSQAPPPVIAPPVVVAGAPNLLPLLAGLGAFAALYFLLGKNLLDDDDDVITIDAPPVPVSPT